MNVWALKKNDDIRTLLIRLQAHIGEHSFCIEEGAEDDHGGVFLYKKGNKNIKAYVHTYGQNEQRYGVHVEYPVFKEQSASDQLQIYEDQSLEQMVSTLAIHFEVPESEKFY